MKKLFLIILAIGFILNVKSQEITRNNIYVELGGAAMMYSVNYERLLSSNRNINFPLRIGLSYTNTNVFNGDNTIGLPISFSFIKNLNRNIYFETRLFVTPFFYQEQYYSQGGSMSYDTENIVSFLPGASIGFRGQPSTAGLYYHIHIQSQVIEKEIGPFLSLGLGYAF